MTGGAPVELWRKAQQALATRRAFWGPELRISAPSFKRFDTVEVNPSGAPRFAALSITGGRCELGCDHCRGALLQSMTAAATPAALRQQARALAKRGCRGALISGGCDAAGQVPLEPFLPVLDELHRELGLELAVHTGLVTPELARALAEVGVGRVMVDLVGDADTAREVLHIEDGPARFEASLEALVEAGLSVAPHLVVGLHRGELRGEREALTMARRHRPDALVIVVVRPEPSTPFAEITPPEHEEVAEILTEARLTLPTTPLYLGCARPVGRRGRQIEAWAIRAGVNGVAFPADATVRLARSLGLEPELEERCCALGAQP